MFRIVLPAFALFLAIRAHAGETLPCDPARMNCSPLVACVEASGEVLRGASFGADSGPFHAESPAGVLCTGSWRRGVMGLGLAEFSCSDGRTGQSIYTYFEPESGTAVGTGRFAGGGEVRFWSGNNLERYFREVAPEERQRMACTPEAMLLS
ncbi:MAG: hypothetical protein MUE52_13795 [Tabrizicola sp.]|jgi:hypothetical protein|nr:hypothetical protein [Tabrizicola sp.]